MQEAGEAAGDAIMAEAPAGNNAAALEQGQHLPDQHQSGQHAQHPHQVLVHPDYPQAQDPPVDPAISAISAPAASPSDASPLPAAVPAAFPKKRRGRPPGRPNATVRDADYEQNPLVQAWNAAKNDRAVPVVSISIRDALTEQSLVHETQRAVFRLPSRETILFVQGWITAKHIASQRPSYVNGLLIHSRGQDAALSCVQCNEKRAKNALGPFLTCRVLPGSYHNSCSNCKWFDNTSACSLYTGPKPNRKRKAKEQLAPPPAAGAGQPSDANGDNKESSAPSAGGHAQHQLQPEANMTPSTHNDLSPHSPPHTEAPSQDDTMTNSHFVLRQPEDEGQLGDDGDAEYVSSDLSAAHLANRPDSFVASQLAAQLLPEIHRPDS